MPNYTTSYSPKNRPRPRKRADVLPGARERKRRRRGSQYLRHSQGFGYRDGRRRVPQRRVNSRLPYALIAVGCAALVFLASILWYANRSVGVTLNGSSVSVRIHSNLQQLIDDQGVEVKPGRLLAVDDSVLKKDGGDRYAVKLDGKKVDVSKLESTQLEGGEKVEVANGADVYEPHQVQATDLQPKLTVEGSGAVQYVKTWGVAGRQEVWIGETSGKTHDRGVVKQTVDCVVKATNIHPDDTKKSYAALTFDEGPGTDTDAILKVLKDKGVKATFFLQGDSIAGREQAVKAIRDAGMEIGTNGFTDTNLTKLSGAGLRNQLTQATDAIKEAGGGSVTLLRPPSGLFSAQNWAESMDVVSAVVTWNLDSGDWLLPGAEKVTSTVVGSASSGSVILLTDNASTSAQTAQALPGIIDQLKAKGFELLSLSDLVKTDQDLAKNVTLSKVSMPKDATLPQVVSQQETGVSTNG